MKESIKISVIVGEDGDDKYLEFSNDGEGWLTLSLGGKEICRLDWDSNLKLAVERMLEIWKVEDE